MTTSQFLLSNWTFNPVVFMCCSAALSGYLGAFRLERRAGWFFAGLALLALTLLSPLSALADGYLFSAHMAQHILLLLMIPAMLLLGIPGSRTSRLRRRVVPHPVASWLAGMGAMWFWHIPVMCNAAVSSPVMHGFQTISLLGLGLLFWWPVWSPDERNRLAPPGAVAYLASACFACGLLGILITLSPVTICSIYTMPPASHMELLKTIRSHWSITPERDQQIGGLLMWVPMCLVYLSAILVQLARWFGEPAVQPKEQV